MKIIALKTNIMCSSCVAKVTPTLNKTVGELNWKVDTQDPTKTLTVNTEKLDEGDVIRAVERARYKAEKISQTRGYVAGQDICLAVFCLYNSNFALETVESKNS